MTTEFYEVLAVKYGDMTKRTRRDNFIGADDHDAPGPIDYFIWVVRNDRRTIIVDTGFDKAEGDKRGRTIHRTPASALSTLAIDASTIDDVVITHLHFDHAGTLAAFPKARFHLQAAEMAYATGPAMCHAHQRHTFTPDHICEMVRNVYSGRVVFYDGDAEIAPGITVHRIGGHSLGLQSLRIATEHGPLVLASDATHFYENFERGMPFPIVADMPAMLKGFDTLRRLAGDPKQIIPGHDPLVLKRYPPLTAASTNIVHRLDIGRVRD